MCILICVYSYVYTRMVYLCGYTPMDILLWPSLYGYTWEYLYGYICMGIFVWVLDISVSLYASPQFAGSRWLLISQSLIPIHDCYPSLSWILDHPQVQLLQMARGSLPMLFPQTLGGNYYQQANIVPEGIIIREGKRGLYVEGVPCVAVVPQYCLTIPSPANRCSQYFK